MGRPLHHCHHLKPQSCRLISNIFNQSLPGPIHSRCTNIIKQFTWPHNHNNNNHHSNYKTDSFWSDFWILRTCQLSWGRGQSKWQRSVVSCFDSRLRSGSATKAPAIPLPPAQVVRQPRCGTRSDSPLISLARVVYYYFTLYCYLFIYSIHIS